MAVAADPQQELLARGHVKLDDAKAGAVLAPVVLLLHQQIGLAESPRGVAVHLLVVVQRLSKADEGQSAFMGESLAHGNRAS